jgi:hypothetical protein
METEGFHYSLHFILPPVQRNISQQADFYDKQLLALAQPPSWTTTPCQLPATADIYLQLPFTSGASSIHNLRTCHARVTKDPLNTVHIHSSYSLSSSGHEVRPVNDLFKSHIIHNMIN